MNALNRLNRRQILKLLAVTTLGPTRTRAAEPNIRWALGAVTWVVKAGKNSPRWADILSDIAASGFEGFEPFTTRTLPVNDENMAALETLAPKFNLRMSGIYWGDEFHKAEKFDALLKESHRFLGYLKRFRSDRLIIGPPGPAVEDERASISNMARLMNAIGKVALEQYQIKVAVHPHVSGLIENPRQIDQLMEETDARYFNLAPDTAQVWMGGGDPVRVIGRYKNRVVYLHYKDLRAYHRGLTSYLDNVVELGRGVIDFPAIHRILKSLNYKGWITIDLDNARVSPLESGKINRAYIDQVLNPIYR
jgi:inosose dehydratase